nr:efflux RND transporter periplasmic adaptor subunit [Clostridium sp. Marseille-P7770]
MKGSSGGDKQGMGGGPGGGPGGMGEMEQQTQTTVVRAEEPETGNIYLTTELTGTVEPDDVVHVYAKASGDITAVNVKAGDTVTKGQVLFTIDTEQVDTAKNSVDSAAVNLQKAQSDLARMQILYDGGDLSDQEYEQYTNAVKAAQLQYNSAKTSYDQQVGYSSVTAPISGKVESCSAEVYDRANMNGELCVISGEGEKKVTFYVTQRMLENLAVGDSLTVEKSGNAYNAVIDEINTMVDDSTGMFKVEAQLADTDNNAATGSTVKLTVTTGKAENVMTIPVDAVYYSGGKAYVYLYEDGKAKKASIEVGINDDDYVEVTDGLSADDLVVSTWSNNLYEGADIQLSGSSDSQAAPEGEAGAPDGQAAPDAAGRNGGAALAGELNADVPADGAGGETPAADNSAAGSSASQEG